MRPIGARLELGPDFIRFFALSITHLHRGQATAAVIADKEKIRPCIVRPQRRAQRIKIDGKPGLRFAAHINPLFALPDALRVTAGGRPVFDVR